MRHRLLTIAAIWAGVVLVLTALARATAICPIAAAAHATCMERASWDVVPLFAMFLMPSVVLLIAVLVIRRRR